VIANNRRLSALREIVRGFAALVADKRGVIVAHVASAHPLSDVQRQQLRARLIEAGYSNVNIREQVDSSLLGGLLVSANVYGLSWRPIFLINLPIGIVGTLAAYLLLHDIAPNPRGERFDLLGAILFCIGLVCLLLGMTSGIGSGWLSPPILTLLSIGVVAFILFVIRERRVSYPMLDLHLFDNRQYGLSVAAAMLQSLATFAVNFILIFYLQGVRGYTPLTAALLILPLPVMTSLFGPIGGRWADRVGGAVPATIGLAIQIAALIFFVLLTPSTPYIVLAFALAIFIASECYRQWVVLETGGDDALFGYDFSQGYTSLERDQPAPPRRRVSWWQRWQQRRSARKLQREQETREAEEQRMDELLEKVQRQGISALTDEERRFMKRVSDRYRNRN